MTKHPLTLRTVERKGKILLEDQDGRVVTNIIEVKRVWHVGDPARMEFALYDTNENGAIYPSPDGWQESLRWRILRLLKRVPT